MLRFIWTIWCSISFAILASLALPFFTILILFGAQRKALRLISFGAKMVLFAWGVRIEEHNREIVTKDTTYVFVANHTSDLDGILSNAILPGYFKFLGKEELVHWPIVGYFVRHLYITVNRKKSATKVDAIAAMSAAAKGGTSIAIFPEGFANFSKLYLLPFKKGAFKVAIDNQLPIAVYTIIGAASIWPKPLVRIQPGKVKVYWEGIIPTKGLSFPADFEALADQVKLLMYKRIQEHYPNGFQYPKNHPDFEKWKWKQLN